jgi:hypothetical protein
MFSGQTFKSSPAHPFWLTTVAVLGFRFQTKLRPYFIGSPYSSTKAIFPLAREVSWQGYKLTKAALLMEDHKISSVQSDGIPAFALN